MNRLQEIDGLRAMAVLAVVVYHFNQAWAPQGHLGVDVFFAISGYVISKSLLESLDAGSFTFNGFFLRRAKRLLPALALVVVATLLVASALLPDKGTFAAGGAALFGLSNLWFWHSGSDYFATSSEWNPLTHTWSLGVEEQFYLAYPVLVAALHRRPRLMLAALGAVGLASLLAYGSVLGQQRMAAFYLSPLRFWEFVAGAAVLLAHRWRGHAPPTRMTAALKHGALAALLGVLLLPQPHEAAGTVLAVAAACLLLWLVGGSPRQNFWLGNPVSQYLGRMSYSLYLWHWPVAVFAKLTLPPHAALAVYAVATAALSAATFHGVEQPLRRRRWALVNDRFAHAFALYATLAMAAWATLYLARLNPWVVDPARQEIQFLRSAPCHIPGADGLALCLKPTVDGRAAVWLIGDSHAGNFAPGLQQAATQLGLGFGQLTGRSLFHALSGQCLAPADCPEGDHGALLRRLQAVGQRGDVVALAFAADRLAQPNRAAGLFQRQLRDFVAALAAHGFAVLLVEDIPKVCDSDGEYFSSAFLADRCRTTAAASKRARAALSQTYSGLRQAPGVKVVDPHDRFCGPPAGGTATCSNHLDGQLLYLDASPHLTLRASNDLGTFFVEALRETTARASKP